MLLKAAGLPHQTHRTMNDEQLLMTRDYSRLSVSLASTAEAARDAALSRSALLGRVSDAPSQEAAVAAQRTIRRLMKSIEQTRKTVKEPVLGYARAIDQTARDFVTPLEEEDLRLGELLSAFQEEQMAVSREGERQRQAELARLEEERAASLRAAEEANSTPTDQALAGKESGALAVRAEEETQRQEELYRQAREAIGGPVVPVKAEGQTVRTVAKYEVTDIWLLTRCHPGFVRIELNRAEINEALNRGIRSIAGLRIWEETVSSVRVGRTREMIDV
jgi:hypothetical protein